MRIVGCTGVPADSHDVIWFQVNKEKQRRCPECGSSAYTSLCCCRYFADTPRTFSLRA
jgi:hypothetical protein